jgi:hypothetical protein
MPSPVINSRTFLAIVAVSAALGCGGCLRDKVQAAAPVAVAPQPDAERPMNVAPDTDALPPPPADAPPPAIPGDAAPPPPSSIPKTRTPPAPPKSSAGQPSSEPATEASAHPPAPQISPQLSPAAQQTYERQTNDDVSVAESNLQRANGRPLNAGQQDMLEKVRSFLEQSRDASKSGDWERAQKLAQKARVLSIELANSL